MTSGLFDAPARSTITANDLVAMLERHYLPPNRPASGIFAAEIEAPSGSRRADLIWAPLTTYGVTGLVGHEVKVTRSDLLNELADPTKADPWARHCTWWWLVVASPAMLEGLTIPDAWGIMAPPSGRRTRSMTIVRQAPRLNPPNDGPGWHRLASWQHHRWSSKLYALERDLEYRTRERDDARASIERADLVRYGRDAERAEQVGRILKALDSRRLRDGDVYIGHNTVTDEDIIEALLSLGTVRTLANNLSDELRWKIMEAERIAEPIKQAAKSLAKLTAKAGAAA